MILPSRADRQLAGEIYSKYSSKLGSMHIAEHNALVYLSASLRRHRPKCVVELGAGIGTMTELILQHPIARLATLETDAFCLAELTELQRDPRLTVATSVATLVEALNLQADLVVVDGGFESDEEFNVIAAGTVVFVEGIRLRARVRLSAALSQRGLIVNLREYGATYVRLWSRDSWLPWPAGYLQHRKGCWIGQVKET